MSVTDANENKAFSGIENKNCYEILPQNSKKTKKAKFQKHFCVIGLE